MNFLSDVNLPDLYSEEYYKLIVEVIKTVEKKLNVSVYGYTDYIRISFHWLDEEGKPFGDPCSMPFSIAKKYLEQ